jgi:hypothetical protein
LDRSSARLWARNNVHPFLPALLSRLQEEISGEDVSLSALFDAIDNTAAAILFGLVFVAVYAVLLLGLLFFFLVARAGWRWLARHTWRDVIVSLERRAIKQGSQCPR